jgi:hypothetical protein
MLKSFQLGLVNEVAMDGIENSGIFKTMKRQ